MKRLLQLMVLIPSILFIIIGFQWLLVPEHIAPTFGLTLGSKEALSSQIGDMTGYFLTIGCCMLLGLVKRERLWYFPCILLLLTTTTARIFAFLFHNASLPLDLIGVEVGVSILLILASIPKPHENAKF